MLDAGAAVVIEVLLDLALPAPLGWLVDREFDPPGAVLHHLAHQRRVLSADVLVVEVDQLREAQNITIVCDPFIHLA